MSTFAILNQLCSSWFIIISLVFSIFVKYYFQVSFHLTARFCTRAKELNTPWLRFIETKQPMYVHSNLVYTYFQNCYWRRLQFLKIALVSAIILFRNSKLIWISEGSTSSINKASRRLSPMLIQIHTHKNKHTYKKRMYNMKSIRSRIGKKLDQFTNADYKQGYK